MPRPSLKTILFAVVALAAVLLVLATCQARKEARAAKAERSVAVAAGRALDRVSEQSEGIREDQKEKEKAVDEIEGADQRLPDGFGAELERLRMRDRDKHRNP